MTDHNQTNAMSDILGKLGQVESGTYKKTGAATGGVDGNDVDAMHDVLARLQEATDGAAYEVVNESKTNHNLAAAVNTTRNETGVTVSHYDIRSEKKRVNENAARNFYSIVDTNTQEVLHSDLGLFESAMGVVKHLLYTQDQQKAQRILDLDQEYVGAMMETYGHKQRLSRLDESSVKYDVTSAKYSNCRNKMSGVKVKLLKAL